MDESQDLPRAGGPRPIGAVLKTMTTQRCAPPRSELPPSSASTPPPSSAPTPDGECPVCRGKEWLSTDLPMGHPQFGDLVPCEACGVVGQRRIARFDRFSSRRGRALDQHFHNFRTDGAAAPATGAFNAAVEFAREPRGWLVIHGPMGCGKSHLAAAVANHVIESLHRPALFLNVPDLLRALRLEVQSSVEGHGVAAPLLEAALEAPVLILDDLGAERGTEFAEEQLFLLLDRRYQDKSPTMVVSNRSPRSLGGRIGSRLGDCELCTVVHNPAPDYRRGDGRVTV